MTLLADFLTPAKLADEFGVSTKTLERWSKKRDGLPYYRIGKRRLYKRETVIAWIRAQEKTPGEQFAGAEPTDGN